MSFFAFSQDAWAQCETCRPVTNNINNLSIVNGETVCIAAGVTVSGRITWNGTGGAICNSGTITADFDVPNQGIVYNNQGATINIGNLNLNGANSQIVNNGSFTARTLSVNRDAQFSNGSGATTTLTNLNLNNGTITNLGNLRVEPSGNGNITLGGTIRNTIGATFAITTSININSDAQIDNLGTFTANNINNSATIRNCGTFRQTVAGNNVGFTNNGLVQNFGLFDILGDFTNNGDFEGATQGGVGIVRVGRQSRQNSGKFAVVGYLNFCRGFDTDNGTTNAANVTCSTSLATAGCRNSPLPVELTSFDAKLSKGSVLLTWTTASEKNNEKFVVERSANGESFEAITEVAGHGTSSSSYSYKTTDVAPLAGTSYYRLRQVDFDGATAYSPVLTIQNAAANQTNKLGVYPNPATDYITLDLPKGVSETYEVRISTVSGKLVRRLDLSGSNPQLDLHALPAGTYLLQVRSANTQTVRRLIKQ
ncbi:T9SS type A sorting domain-containing protein [Hymenobacter sp. GOD-10R]|uniref:T9SS type A sorting domain-containing protein n=1 Tax=Hymenobacter sp. GOD-10R TaxID=3093922 RepID=UPI002D785983|nr:T9SS type A sorting domain-containing protein [Hymenobacter sp. GOD-10R]WRQ27130.1 T9SS type A sorting domain-containing protein [Hymenobacter sp. GOD-10R]